MSSERRPRQDHHEKGENQPDVAEADMNSFEVGNPRLAGLQALDVFFRGRPWLKM